MTDSNSNNRFISSALLLGIRALKSKQVPAKFNKRVPIGKTNTNPLGIVAYLAWAAF